MQANIFPYKNGELIITQSIINAITEVIQEIDIPIERYSGPEINKAIMNQLHLFGWSKKVKIDPKSNITITSMYEKIGLCVQTGNTCRIYADLMKLQVLYQRGAILAGIIILADGKIAPQLAQNMASSTRLIRELPIFNTVITLPLIIVSFN